MLALSLATCLIVQPAPAADDAPPPDVYAPSRRGKRFVFAFLPALTFGISKVPSLDLPFFFGGRLQTWALGLQFTFSSGLAERYYAGVLTHRYHLTAMRSFGRRDRLFFSLGGGVAVLSVYPVVEAETRVALRFGYRRNGTFGAVARLGWNTGLGELAPMPQFGLFLGVTTF